MKTEIIGIITEYNPFHNGHIYQIEVIKKMYPNSIIIVLLNGLFQERGEISILTQEYKTKVALDYGVQLVLELPTSYGTQSADIFADASLKILNNFHITKLVFGSECNDIDMLTNLAKKEFSDEFNKDVKKYLSDGINYPTALAKALNTDFVFNPNDLLAISYIKAIIKHNYNIEAVSIKRTSNYHDTFDNSNVVSASNIREKLKNNIDISKYTKVNKDNIININYNLYFKLLKYKINTDPNLNTYLDVDEGIENRLIKYINKCNTLDELIHLVKTKRYTYNKINRMFIHILLNQKKSNINISYIRVLGFDSIGKKYLNSIKKDLEIPTLVDKESDQYKFELNVCIIYDLINNTNTIDFLKNNKPILK